MKSESGEGEPVVEDDWSEGREDDCMKEEERVELFGQEELGVAGGERLVSALVVASRGCRRRGDRRVNAWKGKDSRG